MAYGRVEAAHAVARRWLLGTPGVSTVARKMRAAAVEHVYFASVRRARSLAPPATSAGQLLVRRSWDRLEGLRRLTRPKILYIGTDEVQDKSGLLQGLATIGEIVPFTQSDGAYGQAPNATLSFDLAAPNGRRLVQLIRDAANAGSPFDLVIGQMWGGFIDVAALAAVRSQFRVPVVNIAMDDRHTFYARRLGRAIGTRLLAPHLDLAATTVPEAVDWYLREGCPALFLPEASDPSIFRPDAADGKRYDVIFVGQRYGIRERLVARLRRSGIEVHAFGSGWPGGRAPFEQTPELFAAARIVLGVGTVGWSERLVALKMRDFDGPMSGSCYLTTRNPDLELVYRVGDEIAVYDGVDECVDVVRSLLADDAKREAIARAGRARAARDHTWATRAETLLRVLRHPLELQGAPPAAASLRRDDAGCHE